MEDIRASLSHILSALGERLRVNVSHSLLFNKRGGRRTKTCMHSLTIHTHTHEDFSWLQHVWKMLCSCHVKGVAMLLTALMEPMRIDHVVMFDLCAADRPAGATGPAPARRWPAFIPATALKYAVTSCASSWLSLSHYSLEDRDSVPRVSTHTGPETAQAMSQRQN